MAYGTRWVLGGAAALLSFGMACTRLNPGFKDSITGSGSGSGTSSADVTGTADSTNDSAEVGVSTSTTDSTDTGTPECLLPWTNSLSFKYLADWSAEPCPQNPGGFFVVRGVSVGKGLLVDPCGVNCEGCAADGNEEIEIFPVDLTDVGADLDGACIFAEWEDLRSESATQCTYDKFMLSVHFGDLLPVVIGSAADGAVPSFAQGATGTGFEVNLTPEEVCDCGNGSPCCEVIDPPTLYAFQLNDGPQISVGDEGPVDIAAGSFDFFAVQAQQIDSCGAPLEVSWLMVQQDGGLP